MEQVKIKLDGNHRLVDGAWHLWTEFSPDEIDGNVGFFDPVADNLGSQSGDQYTTNGSFFYVYCGKPWEDFIMAQFMVARVVKVVDMPGTPEVQERAHWHPMVKRMGDWVHTGVVPKKAPAVVAPRENYVSGDGVVEWNPGKKVHEVIVDKTVVFASAVKQEARDVAAGNKPV